MKKITWIAITVLLIIGLVYLFKSGGGSSAGAFVAGELSPLDNAKGNLEAKVVVMEYSDFQCPACRVYYPVMRQLMQEFGGDAVFVYRHFPLTQIHPNAEFAARAAEAAKLQGKFWEMHDLLFEKQNEWAEANDIEALFVSYAKLIGLDQEKFKTDWRSKEVKDFVTSQKNHALSSGLQGTPTFFVGGEKVTNPRSADEFRGLIIKALGK